MTSIARHSTHSAVKKSRRPELDPCGVVCLLRGRALSRARSNLLHAVVVTLPRIGESSEKRKEFWAGVTGESFKASSLDSANACLDLQKKRKLPFKIMYAFCWSCPSATFASQRGGFVPREWQAAKGLFETTKMLHCLFCRMNPPLVWIQLPDAFSGIHWQVSWKTDAPSCWRHTGTRIRDLKIRWRRG